MEITNQTRNTLILVCLPNCYFPNQTDTFPGVWVREGEKTMSARLAEGLKDFNTAGQL